MQTFTRSATERGGVVSRMYCPSIVFVTVMLTAIGTACRTTSSEVPNLSIRIAAANKSQPCHSPTGCFNPHILVFESGYDITTFAAGRPQHTVVHPEKLRELLLGLPINAWPQGPFVLVTPSDDVTDSESIKKNMTEAEKICRSLGLDVQLRPGG
jgi:hypothetical protein